jgi:penicillin-binding protein 1C
LHTSPCPWHINVYLSTDERFRVYENCAGTENVIQQRWFALPPVWAWYYKQYHPEYKSLPPFRPGCGGDSFNPMQFIYPQGNIVVRLPKQLDGSLGGITFELAHSRPDATVFWHIDNEYITSTNDFHQLTVTLSKGNHFITVVDNEGHTASCQIKTE